MAELPADEVAEVVAIMRRDHAATSLAIVQVNFAANAVAARLVGLDADGGDWEAVYSDDSTRIVRVPWGVPISSADEAMRTIAAIGRAAEVRIAGYHPDVVAGRYLPARPPAGSGSAHGPGVSGPSPH